MNYIYDLYLPVNDRLITHSRVDTSSSIHSSVEELRRHNTPFGWYIQVYKTTASGLRPWTDRYLRTESDIEGEIVSRERDIWLDKPVNKNTPIDSNIKTAAAIGKPKLSAVPPVGLLALGAAMSDGASKYGRFNWRTTEVTASVFYDAMMRHLLGWWSGEDHASDSRVAHLGHLMAGAAIVLDAEMHNVFNDDRDAMRTPLPAEGWWLSKKGAADKPPKPSNFFEDMIDNDLKIVRIRELEAQVASLKESLSKQHAAGN